MIEIAEWNQSRKRIGALEQQLDAERAEVRILEQELSAADNANRRLTAMLQAHDHCDSDTNKTKSVSVMNKDSSCCKLLRQTVIELRDKLEGLQQEVRDTKLTKSDKEQRLQNEITELNEEHIKEKQKIIQLTAQLESQMVATNANQTSIGSQIKVLEDELLHQIGQRENLENAAELAETTVRKLQSQIDDGAVNTNSALHKIETLERELEFERDQQRKLCDKVSKLEQELSAANELIEENQRMDRDLSIKKDNDNEQILANYQQLREQMANMESELEQCGKDRDSALEREQQLQSQIASYNEENAEGDQVIVTLRTRAEELENRCYAANDQVEILERKVADLNAEQTDSIQELKKMEFRNGELVNELNAAQKDHNKLGMKIKGLEEELRYAANAESRRLRNSISEMEAERDDALARERQLQNKMLELEAELESSHTNHGALRKKVLDLEQALSAAKDENRRHFALMQTLDAEKESTLKKQLQEQKRFAELEQDQKSAESEIRKLRDAIETCEAERDAAVERERQLQRKEVGFHKEKQEKNKEIIQLKRVSVELENQLELADVDAKSLASRNKVLESELNHQRSHIDRSQNAAKAEAREFQQQIAQYEALRDVVLAREQRLQRKIEEYDEGKKEGIKELDAERERNSVLENEHSKLVNKVADLEHALFAAEDANRNNQTMIATIDAEQGESKANELRAMLADVERERDEIETAAQAEISELQRELADALEYQRALQQRLDDAKAARAESLNLQWNLQRSSNHFRTSVGNRLASLERPSLARSTTRTAEFERTGVQGSGL